uniref:Uncharacterized protein n=1 Tax=Sphaerodactylus townsendi TaxID=933632 RepID=A0ACB8E7J1_9SAUR
MKVGLLREDLWTFGVSSFTRLRSPPLLQIRAEERGESIHHLGSGKSPNLSILKSAASASECWNLLRSVYQRKSRWSAASRQLPDAALTLDSRSPKLLDCSDREFQKEALPSLQESTPEGFVRKACLLFASDRGVATVWSSGHLAKSMRESAVDRSKPKQRQKKGPGRGTLPLLRLLLVTL